MLTLKDVTFIKHLFDVNLRDFSDSLNAIITTGILLVFCSIISFKSYVVSPLSCFSSTSPISGTFDDYVKSYCWVHGTVVLKDGETPQFANEWKDKHIQTIGYYQWIPFVLLIQCAFFYVPNLIWKAACSHSYGTDLTNIIKNARELSNDISDNAKTSKLVASLEDIFFIHRDYRQGPISILRRKIHKKCNFLVVSKRLATKLSFCYMFVKVLYLANSIGQIFLVKTFLNIDNWIFETYWNVLKLIFTGNDWQQSEYFPRVSFCRVQGIRSVGVSENTYTAQCVLPVNMFNEKIFIFLFLWYNFVSLMTFMSLIVWFLKLGRKSYQVSRVKEYLKMRMNYKKVDRLIIERFVYQFLRIDGMFLMEMIRARCGDAVTSTIVNGLYSTYCQKYRHLNFNDDKTNEEVDSISFKLEPGGKGSVKYSFPNAPQGKEYIL